MRYQLLFALLVIVFSSCSTMKPTTTSSAGQSASRNAAPKFLENISIKSEPENNPTVVHKPVNNTTILKTDQPEISEIEAASQLFMKYAILMNAPVEELDNEKMLTFIDEWYGTRYRFGGSDKTGIDCSAFVQLFMSTMYGFTLPRISKEQYLQTFRIQKNSLQEGDLVFFHTTRRGISHVGIYLRNNKFVHASTAGGVTISDMSEGYYAQRFVCGGRVRDGKFVSGN